MFQYHCKECEKTIIIDSNNEVPECCGKEMYLMDVCREAPSAEHYRPYNSDDPCDDASSGERK